MFSSLSKRSNVPGMRSGFVAGDADVIQKYLLYRTYQGCAMSPPVQAASIAAWKDEAHVVENRRLYREKFETALEHPSPARRRRNARGGVLPVGAHARSRTPSSRAASTKPQAVSVLPGSYLAREARGVNPGHRPRAHRARVLDRGMRRGRAAHPGFLSSTLVIMRKYKGRA